MNLKKTKNRAYGKRRKISVIKSGLLAVNSVSQKDTTLLYAEEEIVEVLEDNKLVHDMNTI